MTLIRQPISKSSAHGVIYTSEANDALDYLDSLNSRDRTILENALISRYATKLGIREGENGERWEEYTRADVSSAITAGRVEIVTTHAYRRIVQSMSTLATEKTQSWQWLDESGEQVEDVTALITEQRDKSQFRRNLIRADRLSCALGSAAIWITWRSGNLRYQAVPPQSVTLLFAADIDDDGEQRSTDMTSLEDCSAVVVDTGAASGTDSIAITGQSSARHYIAYMGASTEHEHGRCVRWVGTDPTIVPPFGAGIATDLLDSEGLPYNPMTVLHLELPELCPHEYPIAIWYGSDAGMDESLLPLTGLSLYRDTRELDMCYSRIAQCAIKSARGVFAIANPNGEVLPSNPDEGIVALRRDQTIEVMGQPGGNSTSALEVVQALHKSIAESWHVPSHEVMADDAQPESGIAIALRSQDKIDYRRERYEINRHGAQRIWEIERALLSIGLDNYNLISPEIKQVWDCGQWAPPALGAEVITELKAAYDMGLIDQIEAIRRYYRLATTDEAVQIYEQLQSRRAEYPAEEKDPFEKMLTLSRQEEAGDRWSK
jgi:hypothetical protein